jgi:preprotein translocase subunit SecA
MVEILDDVAVAGIEAYLPEKSTSDTWDIEGLKKWYQGIFQKALTWEDDKVRMMDREAAFEALKEEMVKAYEEKEKVLTPEVMRVLERSILLQVVDGQWKDHLLSMDHLKDGIGLQAYGQKDPLIEYKRQGFAQFQELVDRVKQDATRLLFMIQTVSSTENLFPVNQPVKMKEEHPDFDPHKPMVPTAAPVSEPAGLMGQNAAPVMGGGPAPLGGQPWEQQGELMGPSRQAVKTAPIRREEPKVGRNDACPCGSGKKYKKCHGA